MLDQNTDRMWYVIGAVIIGAAILFILNGTFPTVFSSILGSFSSKTEAVGQDIDDLTITDGIGPAQPNRNLIPNSDDLYVWGYKGDNARRSYNEGWTRFELPTKAVEYGFDTYVTVQPNTEYTESYYIKTDATALLSPRISFYQFGKDHYFVTVTTEKVGNDLWRVVGTGVTQEGQTDLRAPDTYIFFEGGTYAEFGQFKLEKGGTATPWRK